MTEEDGVDLAAADALHEAASVAALEEHRLGVLAWWRENATLIIAVSPVDVAVGVGIDGRPRLEITAVVTETIRGLPSEGIITYVSRAMSGMPPPTKRAVIALRPTAFGDAFALEAIGGAVLATNGAGVEFLRMKGLEKTLTAYILEESAL